MQAYIHVRLAPDTLSQPLRDSAQLRAAVFKKAVMDMPMDELRRRAIRRQNRRAPEPRYISYAIAVDSELFDKLKQLPKSTMVSLSALAQYIFAEDTSGAGVAVQNRVLS
jgi:hypothetical protein